LVTRHFYIALGVVAMIATIVGLDLLVFRDHFWARLLANIGIVMVCAAFYLRFGASP
jgi:predicted cobalt transporter CbtA